MNFETTCCWDCPFYIWNQTRQTARCHHPQTISKTESPQIVKSVNAQTTMPDWCPLEEIPDASPIKTTTDEMSPIPDSSKRRMEFVIKSAPKEWGRAPDPKDEFDLTLSSGSGFQADAISIFQGYRFYPDSLHGRFMQSWDPVGSWEPASKKYILKCPYCHARTDSSQEVGKCSNCGRDICHQKQEE